MQFVSTRGSAPAVDLASAVLSGLAPDGGLYVPRAWPQVEIGGRPGDPFFWQVIAEVIEPFAVGLLDRTGLEAMAEAAFSDFASPVVAPIRTLDRDLYLMELFWGPTLAFKDFGMSMLARLFDLVLAERGGHATIIGATSGDTGSAAMEASRDRDHIDVIILHPAGRTTEVQRRQMTTIPSENVHAVAVDGTFDDCQDLMKAAFTDEALRSEMRFSTANSINFGRLLTQIAYYYVATQRLGRVSFAVPSGNFGNVYSAYAAAEMGAPIDRLIVGSNENNVLDRFFLSGVLELGEVTATISPSMDVQIPSNLERLIFDLLDRDGDRVVESMAALRSVGRAEIGLGPAADRFVSEWYNDDTTRMIMADVFAATGQIIDPHTAIGVGAARASGVEGPIVCLGTAHPSKFAAVVGEATGQAAPLPGHLADLHERPERLTTISNELGEFERILCEFSRFT